MTQINLEQVEKILNKHFCFMEWQEKDAITRNYEIMGIDDIEFLLSLDTKGNKISSFETTYGKIYDSEKLFKFIEDSKSKGFLGVSLVWSTLTSADEIKLSKLGYLIKQTGHGSIFWDEIYFTKNAYITNEVRYFQNLFGSIKNFTKENLM